MQVIVLAVISEEGLGNGVLAWHSDVQTQHSYWVKYLTWPLKHCYLDIKGCAWCGCVHVCVCVCLHACVSEGSLHKPISGVWASALQTVLSTPVQHYSD